MKTITVELSEEVLAEILPILERKEQLLHMQVAKIRAGLAGHAPENGRDNNQMPLRVVPEKTASGRAKKGESEKLIVDYLKSTGGHGAAVKEIAASTKAAYGSCIRILRKLKQQGDVNSRKRLWYWNAKKKPNTEGIDTFLAQATTAR
jgi:DNA invertase Pin-like site-specific DNA recombinase